MLDRRCTYIDKPIIGANGKKKTAEFSKRREDMNDFEKETGEKKTAEEKV